MILHETVTVRLGGWGRVFNFLTSRFVVGFLTFMVETGIAAYKAKDWVAIAKGILGIAVMAGV